MLLPIVFEVIVTQVINYLCVSCAEFVGVDNVIWDVPQEALNIVLC